MAMVQELIPPQRRSEGTGYLSLGTTLSAALGPAVALLVLGSFDYQMLFIVVLGISIFSLIASVFLYFRSSESAPELDENGQKPAPPKFNLKSIVNPKIVPIGLFMLIVCLAYSGVISHINGFAEQRDVVTGAGFFFIAYALSMFVMRSYLGKLQDRRGDNIVIYLGLFFQIISFVILFLSTENWQVVIAGLAAGLGYGTLMPAAQSIAVGVVDKREFGSAFSTLFLFVDIGFGIGPIVLGALATSIGFGPMYAVLAVVSVLAGIYYLFAHAGSERAKRGVVENIDSRVAAKK